MFLISPDFFTYSLGTEKHANNKTNNWLWVFVPGIGIPVAAKIVVDSTIFFVCLIIFVIFFRRRKISTSMLVGETVSTVELS